MATMAAPMAEMSAGAGDGGGAPMDLGALLDTGFDAAVGSDGDATGVPNADPVDDIAPPAQDAPGSETPVGDEAAPAAEPIIPVDPNNPYAMSPDGKGFVVPKTELPQLQGYKQYAEAVQQKFPTPADAEVAYAQSSDFQAILNDLQYGGETELDAVLGFLSGSNATDPQLQASMRAGFERLASRVPQILSKMNPQAHASHVDSMVQSRVEEMYRYAQESGNPDDLLNAQRLDWGLTGKYKTELEKLDPMRAQQEQLTRQQQAVQQQENQLLERDWSSFNKNSVDGPKWGEFNSAINKALEPIKASYAPEVFDAVRARIAQQVIEGMQKDFEFARTQNIVRTQIQKGYEGAWRNRQPTDALNPRIQAYTQNFMARARQILPSVAKPLLDKAAGKPAAPKAAAPPQQSPQNQPTQRAANGQFRPSPRISVEDALAATWKNLM
jgi:hypothetical protein